MKGQGTTVSSLLMIIIMVGLLVTYWHYVDEAKDKENKIALEKSEILITKHAFYLLNSSLNTTWYISSIQTLFKAGESFSASVCGNSIDNYLNDSMDEYLDITKSIKFYETDAQRKIEHIHSQVDSEDSYVKFNVFMDISVESTSTLIASGMEYVYFINTFFKNLVGYGCEAIAMKEDIKDGVNNYGGTQVSYISAVGGYIESELDSISTRNGVTKEIVKNELYLSTDLSGLILNYDYTIKFKDPYEYYYHDEQNNNFAKKPISIDANIADSKKVLSCGSGLYNWNSRDLLCCGQLYTCGVGESELPGIGGNNLGHGNQLCNYACTGTYFCTIGGVDGDASCCTAWGGRYDDCCETYKEEICEGETCTTYCDDIADICWDVCEPNCFTVTRCIACCIL